MNEQEKKLSKLYVDKLRKQRAYFQYADASQNLLESQKDDDLLFLQEAFIKWINGLKEGDARKAELNLLLKSIWRIQAYCGNLETVCKASVVELINLEDKISNLESRNKILELEKIQINNEHQIKVKALEAEIEFTTKNS
jgi:hypothetical protein